MQFSLKGVGREGIGEEVAKEDHVIRGGRLHAFLVSQSPSGRIRNPVLCLIKLFDNACGADAAVARTRAWRQRGLAAPVLEGR
jgi:hypothetical protein